MSTSALQLAWQEPSFGNTNTEVKVAKLLWSGTDGELCGNPPSLNTLPIYNVQQYNAMSTPWEFMIVAVSR